MLIVKTHLDLWCSQASRLVSSFIALSTMAIEELAFFSWNPNLLLCNIFWLVSIGLLPSIDRRVFSRPSLHCVMYSMQLSKNRPSQIISCSIEESLSLSLSGSFRLARSVSTWNFQRIAVNTICIVQVSLLRPIAISRSGDTLWWADSSRRWESHSKWFSTCRVILSILFLWPPWDISGWEVQHTAVTVATV